MSEVIRRIFSSNCSVSELSDDNYWKVTCYIENAIQNPDGYWDTRRISVMSIDKDEERAFKTASEAVANKYKQLNFNLFNMPAEESVDGIKNPIDDYKTELESDYIETV